MSSKAMRDRYEGKFLEGADLMTRDSYSLVIASVADPGTVQDSRQQVIEEAVIGFEKATKRLVLGKTNYRILVAQFGSDEKEWVGKTVKLQCRFLDCFGEVDVPCVRIVPPDGTPVPKGARDFMGSFHPKHGPRVTRSAAGEQKPVKKRSTKKPPENPEPPSTLLNAYEFALKQIVDAQDQESLDQVMVELEPEPWTESERKGLQAQFVARTEQLT